MSERVHHDEALAGPAEGDVPGDAVEGSADTTELPQPGRHALGISPTSRTAATRRRTPSQRSAEPWSATVPERRS